MQLKNRITSARWKNRAERVLILIGCLAVAGTVLSWFASLHWIADMLSHLRVQYAILLLPLLVIVILRGKRWLAFAIVGLVTYNVWPTFPYFATWSHSSIAISG